MNTKAVFLSDPDNRELLTSVECISAGGWAIEPMVIMAGRVFLEKHFDNDLNDDVLFAISDTGYSNAILGIEWIKHFQKQTVRKVKGVWRMLIFDGHSSHLIDEFIYYCWQHSIVAFLLPSHSTHLLQPLDIGIF